MFNEMHIITLFLGLGYPGMMERNTTGNFKTLEILKLKELPIPKLTHPSALTLTT